MQKEVPTDKVIRGTKKKNIIKPVNTIASSECCSHSSTALLSSSPTLSSTTTTTTNFMNNNTTSSTNTIVIPKRKDSRGTPMMILNNKSPRTTTTTNTGTTPPQTTNRMQTPKQTTDNYTEERKKITVLTNNLQEIARAMDDHEKLHDCEISIRMNDILVVLKDYDDRLWCKNVSDNNKLGFVLKQNLRRIGKVSIETATKDIKLDMPQMDDDDTIFDTNEEDRKHLERAKILLKRLKMQGILDTTELQHVDRISGTEYDPLL
jgi:hypothetical protein